MQNMVEVVKDLGVGFLTSLFLGLGGQLINVIVGILEQL
jgi:hypothetical protein